jgi:uncharacterized protein YjbI with pentapeptide repeats
MKIESEKHRMEIHKADLSGSKFDDVNLSGSDSHNVNLAVERVDKAKLTGSSLVNARLDGATIDGISVVDLLGSWHTAHEAKSA